MQDFPRQRGENLVITELEEGLLVYDQADMALHALNGVTVSVWNTCDGLRSVSQIEAVTGFDRSVIDQALVKLSQAKLLVEPFAATQERQSRRRFLRKTAVGAGMAVPVIISITAPAAATGASQCSTLLNFLDECTGKINCCIPSLTCRDQGDGSWYCLA